VSEVTQGAHFSREAERRKRKDRLVPPEKKNKTEEKLQHKSQKTTPRMRPVKPSENQLGGCGTREWGNLVFGEKFHGQEITVQFPRREKIRKNASGRWRKTANQMARRKEMKRIEVDSEDNPQRRNTMCGGESRATDLASSGRDCAQQNNQNGSNICGVQMSRGEIELWAMKRKEEGPFPYAASIVGEEKFPWRPTGNRVEEKE